MHLKPNLCEWHRHEPQSFDYAMFIGEDVTPTPPARTHARSKKAMSRQVWREILLGVLISKSPQLILFFSGGFSLAGKYWSICSCTCLHSAVAGALFPLRFLSCVSLGSSWREINDSTLPLVARVCISRLHTVSSSYSTVQSRCCSPKNK